MSVCLHNYVCLSIGLSVGGLFGGRSVYMFAFLSVSQSVCLWSICLCAYLRASVCLYLSVYLSLSLFVGLFVCCRSVGRSSVFLSCRSVTVCTKRAGNGGEDAESESRRQKATHTRATDWADEC